MELRIRNQEEFDNRPRLPLDVKEKWLEALRSGKYKKGFGHLLAYGEYCCLGVLCEIQNRPKYSANSEGTLMIFDDSSRVLSVHNPMFNILSSHGTFRGFTIVDGYYGSLALLNDATDTFDEVIDVIEKYF